jgi:brefeldin A-inhibited guanine nucleotide-exchange protein
MDRIRFIWAKMWALVRDHFSEVGTKANTRVAISAVDMLK